MKIYIFCILLLGCLPSLVLGTPANNPGATNASSVVISPYAVTERSANQRVWQRVTAQTDQFGNTTYRTNSYQELATGLCFWNGNQWADSSDQIQITQTGAAATNTQHSVAFAANINTAGTTDLLTPDGQHMTSQITGLAYYDSATSNSVLFAELQDSIGQILPSGNQVIYTNAFTNANCDVLYTHKLAGFEQDIVVRKQLPSPASYGLTGSNIWLQVWTEFTTAPAPQITEAQRGDYLLNFGTMKMGRGKAFMLGAQSNAVPVIKNWVTTQGRTFLVESVLLNSISAQMAQLPAVGGSSGNSSSPSSSGSSDQAQIRPDHQSFASLPAPHPNLKTLKLPPPKLAKGSSAPMSLASATPNPKGLVLDYYTFNGGQTDFTFQSDTTYYVTNEVDLSGTTTFEGGTVVKFAANNVATIVPSSVVWETSPYRPAIFTAQDDDSVGGQISGSTGDPTEAYYGAIALNFNGGSTPDLYNARFSFLNSAISASGMPLRNVQFVNCQSVVAPGEGNGWLNMYNVLVWNVVNLLAGYGDYSGQDILAVNCTIDGCDSLYGDPTGAYIVWTNCILNSVYDPPASWKIEGFFNTAVTTDSSIFQTVGAGTHYLADNTYRGQGTTSIDSTLLAELPQLTTYPPIVYASTNISNNLVLSNAVPRDTGSNPDLGYHYPVIDYALGDVLLTTATLTVTPGTVIAMFATNGNPAGLTIGAGGQLICQGTPTNLNRIIAYDTVQEEAASSWSIPANGLLQPNPSSDSPGSVINCRFTDFSVIAQDAAHIYDADGNSQPVNFQDCQFHGGTFYTTNTTVNLLNCLLERVNATLWAYDGNAPTIRNNLFWAGNLDLQFTPTNSLVQDNLFDQTTINDHGITSYVGTYNAYLVNSNHLTLTNANDVFLSASPVYQAGPLGNYYQPTSDPLFQVGNTNAALVGLYDYTTQTDQTKDGAYRVTIGYHYVALDGSGNPFDTYWYGIPDYLADSAGTLAAWELKYFGHLGLDPYGSYNGDGTNNFQKYLNGIDPNIISFALSVPNQFVVTNVVGATVTILGGVPASIAVLVDSTNFTGATWTAYSSSNITVTLLTNQGPHDIWVGLKGLPSDAQQTWDETTVMLDSAQPSITITNPANSASFNASRVNVAGNFAAGQIQQITVNGGLAFINGTNFEVVNVLLTGGANTITAIVQDLNGNTNTASITITALTNSDGTLTDPVQLSAIPLAGFYPLDVAFQAYSSAPGTLQQVYYDFHGDGIADYSTNNLSSLSYTYPTNGQFIPGVTIQTTSGRFSSAGGSNALFSTADNRLLRINVLAPPVLVSTINITDPVDLKWISTSNLYVLSGSTSTINEYDTNGSVIRSISAIGSTPSGLDVDATGNVYVVIAGSNQVCRFKPTTSSFQVDTTFGTNGYIGISNGTSGTNSGQFNSPYDVAISPDGGTISVSDSGNDRIQQFDTNGVYIASFGTSGSDIGQFDLPAGLTYDGTGTLYIMDTGNNRLVFTESSTVVGASGTSGTGLLQFSTPMNVSVGERGIYVADTSNNRIQSFDPLANGVYSFAPSDIRFGFSTNFTGPLAVAAVNNLTNEMFYVADTGNNRVVLYKLPGDDPMPAWNNMTNRIASGDIAGAVLNFCNDSADNYRQAFLSIGTNGVITDLNQAGTLTPVFIKSDSAEYYFEKSIEGHTILFPVEFTKENGVWKIISF